MNAKRGMVIATAGVVVVAVVIVFASLGVRFRSWRFKGVSTTSGPYDSVVYNGAPCPTCNVLGPTMVVTNDEYAATKSITDPDGWRLDITWWFPNGPDPVPLEKIRWRFRGALFTFMGPSAGSILPRPPESWQEILAKAQQENGAPSGRTTMPDQSEFVYWGKVSIYPRYGGSGVYHCESDCLVLFRWSDHYTIHLATKMKPGISGPPVP